MCGLAAVGLSALYFLGVLYGDPSLTALKENDENNYNKQHCKDDHSGKSCHCELLACHKLLIERHEVIRHTGNDIDQKYDRYTVSDAVFRNTLADPHQECTSGCQRTYHDRTVYEIVCFQKSLASESDCKRG